MIFRVTCSKCKKIDDLKAPVNVIEHQCRFCGNKGEFDFDLLEELPL